MDDRVGLSRKCECRTSAHRRGLVTRRGAPCSFACETAPCAAACLIPHAYGRPVTRVRSADRTRSFDARSGIDHCLHAPDARAYSHREACGPYRTRSQRAMLFGVTDQYQDLVRCVEGFGHTSTVFAVPVFEIYRCRSSHSLRSGNDTAKGMLAVYRCG